MIYEERIYEIPNQVRKAFHERFENFALPIMAKYDFKVIGCWDEEIGEMQNFVYLLAWPDMNARTAAWAKFNADPDWTEAKRSSTEKHGQLVAKTRNKILRPTSYSLLL